MSVYLVHRLAEWEVQKDIIKLKLRQVQPGLQDYNQPAQPAHPATLSS